MKTRILAFLLAFSCLFCLSACSESETPSARHSLRRQTRKSYANAGGSFSFDGYHPFLCAHKEMGGYI